MSKTSAVEQEAIKEWLKSIFLNPIVDAWILMLSLGGLAEQLNKPALAISYWSSLLVIIISICIIPMNYRTNAYLVQIFKLLEKGAK